MSVKSSEPIYSTCTGSMLSRDIGEREYEKSSEVRSIRRTLLSEISRYSLLRPRSPDSLPLEVIKPFFMSVSTAFPTVTVLTPIHSAISFRVCSESLQIA